MPYQEITDLPAAVRRVLPHHAQEIYKEAYNNALGQYREPSSRRGDDSQEEVAHKVAWAAVKEEYAKGDDGRWHRR